MPELIFAGLVTAAGWFATYYFGKLRDDRTKRLELRIKQLEQQIEEFYGPLYNLVIEIEVSKQVLDAIVDEDISKLSSDNSREVKIFVREKHMKPLHEQIISILHTKMYLVESGAIPASFREYLHHAFQERLQQEIWTQLKISTVKVVGKPFPSQFTIDVQSGLLAAMKRYDDAVGELGPRRKQRIRARPKSLVDRSSQGIES